MAKKKIVVDEKLDGVFRIFQKTNSLKAKTVIRIELPNNEVHEKNYGILPKFEIVIPYVGETFELYLDDELVGLRTLSEASKQHMKFDLVEQ